ncbi:type II toxin-antitoxin system RelE/ParE family toxin [Collinsella tanakaei]|uniref:type II toxin-antitoxin system RelE/ParE family toxin n=1 Tax=Collinsella tanakaei TaxID=626935 RepID=UPI0025A38AB2|nr:type II toxin-antitoxin system RelE/ParE family toxin [Collinsella tanakaei]MDM8300221.1 type II toxin-antitoxin system RelE/ParE family toxin [Collinsella tanakaei]
MTYRVTFANSALDFIEEHVYSERILERIETYAELLADYPRIGTVYEPSYPAAKLPLPCRYINIPDTPFTLFYSVDDAVQEIDVLYVNFSAGNPRGRF